ncbi:hypothetical protein CGJ07_23490 [Vibrio parahaemolyticus]|uniref:hypothetical protein n=1 Tax=Vibrio parahaemolyticus TaxID=670 RepID=UPI0011249C4A|nr:hypothetical protein [Vibrio parahaemolyticus]EKZ9012018.1 hypothetical protein [Vibrio alginolyticus]TOG16098.1 hypothetical protein CGJ07_23490 [Vibrio parahaemolyticus]
MTQSVGKQLEDRGWLQGSIIEKVHSLPLIFAGTCIDVDPNELAALDFVLIIATQSCNIANANVNTVQLAVAYHIDSRDRNKEFNKHPRELDTRYISLVESQDGDGDGDGNNSVALLEHSVRINILEKIFIPKEMLLDIPRNEDLTFQEYDKSSFVDWLGSHYTKPALPTQFNDMIATVRKKKSKPSRKKEKALVGDFLGVYVNIHPDRDLKENEQYKVQMLGLVDPTADLAEAQGCLDNYATILSTAGMNVVASAKHSTKISVAVLQDFKRLYLDELSYSEENDVPPDVRPGIY